MAKIIQLSKGQSTIVDDDIYALFGTRNLHARYSKFVDNYYAMIKVDGKSVNFHRLIMEAPIGMDIDHINGNTLDNRLENLRIATRAQNCWNRKKPISNTSGFKGIYWRKDRKVFTVKLVTLGVNRYVGYFHLLEDAKKAYEKAIAEDHGEFARLA